MSDIEKKARVLMTPVQEYTPGVIAYLFQKITGQNLTDFMHDVHINKNGQYDYLFKEEKGEILQSRSPWSGHLTAAGNMSPPLTRTVFRHGTRCAELKICSGMRMNVPCSIIRRKQIM